MSTIFISYRRNDSEGEAGRLADDLGRRFGEEAVFMDVDTIQPGRDFRKAIDESIRSCDVLLALVGPDWAGAVDSTGKLRLYDESDYVRLEIASALKRDIAVVPVLIRGAHMPRHDALPPDLADFAYRNCVELTHARWRSDVQCLIEALLSLLRETPDARTDTAAADAFAPAHAAPTPSSSRERAVAHPPASPTPASPLSPELLSAVSHELARYIGPIASVLVQRASRTSSTPDELFTRVAQEVESPADRAAFLALRNRLGR